MQNEILIRENVIQKEEKKLEESKLILQKKEEDLEKINKFLNEKEHLFLY